LSNSQGKFYGKATARMTGLGLAEGQRFLTSLVARTKKTVELPILFKIRHIKVRCPFHDLSDSVCKLRVQPRLQFQLLQFII
jgi:hypothetical protein